VHVFGRQRAIQDTLFRKRHYHIEFDGTDYEECHTYMLNKRHMLMLLGVVCCVALKIVAVCSDWLLCIKVLFEVWRRYVEECNGVYAFVSAYL